MSEAATAKKKEEIARGLREDAANKTGKDQALKLMESLCYSPDAGAAAKSTAWVDGWLADLKALPTDRLEEKKGEVMQVNNAIQYLVKFKFLPDGVAAKPALESIIKARGWDKK
jgi:hypothetical protein